MSMGYPATLADFWNNVFSKYPKILVVLGCSYFGKTEMKYINQKYYNEILMRTEPDQVSACANFLSLLFYQSKV
jgi:hypothetical protein